jgi:hypothetical protein
MCVAKNTPNKNTKCYTVKIFGKISRNKNAKCPLKRNSYRSCLRYCEQETRAWSMRFEVCSASGMKLQWNNVDIVQRYNGSECNSTDHLWPLLWSESVLTLIYCGLWSCWHPVVPNTPKKFHTKNFFLFHWTGRIICSMLLNNTVFHMKCAWEPVIGLKWQNWDLVKIVYIFSLKYFPRMYPAEMYVGKVHFAFLRIP